MGSLCTRSGEPASPPFGQRNCPEMDSCAQGRAYRKWNHTQYLWLPRGLATHWPGHPAAADRHADSRLSKSFSQGQPPSSIRHTFRLQEETTGFVLLTATAPLTSHFLLSIQWWKSGFLFVFFSVFYVNSLFVFWDAFLPWLIRDTDRKHRGSRMRHRCNKGQPGMF